MAEEPEAPRPRRIAPELWAAIIIVAVCLGAYVGPKLHAHWQHERTVGQLVAQLSPKFDHVRDGPVIRQLMSKSWPEVDTALRRYADQSEGTAYVCGRDGRKFIYVFTRRLLIPGEGFGPGFTVAEQPIVGYLADEGDTAGALPGVGEVRLRSRGETFEMTYMTWIQGAKALGVPAGKEWVALLTPAELSELIGICLEPGAPSEYADGLDLRCARFLLRKAGALPPSDPRH